MANRYLQPTLNRKILGTYEYYQNKVIGRGSCSIVYQGKKTNTNQKICIKQINTKSSIIEKLAKNQLEILKKISHQNVLKFIAHFQRGSFIYIVTELCQMNLLTKIKTQGKTPQKEALKEFLQILEGYQELRNRGFIHRDIKPQNILIKNNVLKLADFGYSTLLKNHTIQETYNLGTPLYMAPETLFQNKYSEKTDIWSLGIALYEMLSGTVPFISKSEQDLKKQLKKPLKPLNCEPSVMKIITNCLAFEPSNRYDLQKLLLEVKLAINELNQKERRKSNSGHRVKTAEICLNELNYIRFLEYIKFLASRVKNLNQSIREKIDFICQYKIRMRLELIEPLFEEDKICIIQPQIESIRIKMQNQHQFNLPLPSNLGPFSRLHFFSRDTTYFKQSLHWQIQAQIKDIIKEILHEMDKLQTELSIILNEDKIKLLDFLLVAFVLNKILIEKSNSPSEFARLSNLSTILNSPCRVTLKVFEKIRKKAAELQIL